MSPRIDAATARLRLVLVLAVGGLIAQLMPSVSAASVEASSGVALAALACAVAAIVILRCQGAVFLPATFAQRVITSAEAPHFVAGGVTDTPHHPLRPRAPGLV